LVLAHSLWKPSSGSNIWPQLTCRSHIAKDFRALKGSEDYILVNQLNNLVPNCFILHLAVFLDHLYPNAVEAASLAVQAIKSTLRNKSGNEHESADAMELLGLT
jgi:hypothetical protein